MRYQWLPILGLGMAAFTLSGCGSNGADTTDKAWPEARPLWRDLPAVRAPAQPAAHEALPITVSEPSGVLELRQALALALLQNPELSAFSLEVRAAEARSVAAAAIPNPDLAIEVENFGGRLERRRFQSAETTLAISQLIELGGKRASRIRMANLQRDLAGWDYETKRLDVLSETAQAFVDVIAAQRKLALAERQLQLAQRVSGAVGARVRAGTESPVEERRTRVALATSRAEMESARRALEQARISLAAHWGGATPRFERAEGAFDRVGDIPALQRLLDATAENPDLARWSHEIGLREAGVEVERAKRIPDLTVTAGVRRYAETDDNAFVAGISLPIPIFGANPGAVAEARHNLSIARENRRGAEIRVRSELTKAYEGLAGGAREVEILASEGVPNAEAAIDAAQQAYSAGKFGLLQVLDAQRDLIESQARYIDALAEYHKSAAEVERLVGAPLNAIPR